MGRATRTIRRVALVGAAVLVCTAPAVATANPVDDLTATISTFQSMATSLCLDSNTDGYAYTLACNNGRYQDWIYTGSGAISIMRDRATGLCLDSNGTGSVYTRRCAGSDYQRWAVGDPGNRVVNAATGRCLDSNAMGTVYTLPCNEGAWQNWWHR